MTDHNSACAPERKDTSSDASAASARSQFYASMGHTLRTPLNAMKGFAGILQEEVCGTLNDRQREFVDGIVEASNRQLEIISNLTHVAKLDSGQISPEISQVSVRQVILDAFAQFRSRGEERGLRMDLRCDDNIGEVTGDRVLLTTAVANLLSNSVRLTDSGGAVSITAASHPLRGTEASDSQSEASEEAWIEVRDTAMGISPDTMAYIFGDFENAGSVAARRLKSTGSGLALSRRVVELHGGRIWVESEGVKGEGSRFFIVLPAHTQGIEACLT